MAQIHLSYIIPFYNGQDTILNALNSIYSIELAEDNFEVIIIDDMSPCPVENALGKFINEHKNLSIIHHTQNKRQGGAKNTGIRAAKGKYIAFADQDDVIVPENMYAAIKVAEESNVDMLSCHYYVRNETGAIFENGISQGNGMLLTGKEFTECYFDPKYNLAPWANLYKRDFVLRQAHPYEENVLMEDSDWIAWHWIHAEKIGIFNKPIYTWVLNSFSITHSYHYLNRADRIKMGYRKIRDARLYKDISPNFSNLMVNDGRWNIIGGMKKVWKVDNYYRFYRHLSDVLPELQTMKWPGFVKIQINYPTLSLILLYPMGSILKFINYARYKFFL